MLPVASHPRTSFLSPELVIQQLESRILKRFSLCPAAAESAETIAHQWLAGENDALVRLALEGLERRGVLVCVDHDSTTLYGLHNNGWLTQLQRQSD